MSSVIKYVIMKISKSYLKKFISIGLVTLVSVLLIVSCTSKQNNKIDINNISYPNTIAENAKISVKFNPNIILVFIGVWILVSTVLNTIYNVKYRKRRH